MKGVLAPDPLIGGQAVIEGVMMRAPRSLAVAGRRPAGDVVVLREPLRLLADPHRFLRHPFRRGTPAIVEALTHGIRASNGNGASGNTIRLAMIEAQIKKLKVENEQRA